MSPRVCTRCRRPPLLCRCYPGPQPTPAAHAVTAKPHSGLVHLRASNVGKPGEVRGGFAHAPGGWCE